MEAAYRDAIDLSQKASRTRGSGSESKHLARMCP